MTHKSKYITGLALFFCVFLIFSEFAAATPRNDLLIQFVKNNQASNGAFRDTNNSTTTEIDAFTSYANTFIIVKFDKIKEIANDTARTWFVDQFKEQDQTNLKNMYYAFLGLTALGGSINSSDLDSVKTIILNQQDSFSNGFRSKSDLLPTVAATFYAVSLLKVMNRTSVIDATNISKYIMSTWNDTTGAFAGSNQSNANPIDSYYAIKTLQTLDQLTQLTTANQSKLTTYIDSYYSNNSNYPIQYGGYSFTKENPISSIVLTYYCVEIQKILSGIVHQETLTWILSRQSAGDYGFQEYNTLQTNTASSGISSYYALGIMINLDADGIEGKITENVWRLTIDPWIMAAVIIVAIVVIAGLLFGIYKFKNR